MEENSPKYTVYFNIRDLTFFGIKVVDSDWRYVSRPEIFSKVLSRYFNIIISLIYFRKDESWGSSGFYLEIVWTGLK